MQSKRSLPFPKKDALTPNALGREHLVCFVVPPKFGGTFLPFFRANGAAAGDFGKSLIRMLGGCPSRPAPQKPCSKLASSLIGVQAVLLPRHGGFSQRIFFLALSIMRQSRSPRCRPKISISADARFVAQGTLYVSHRCSVRMSR